MTIVVHVNFAPILSGILRSSGVTIINPGFFTGMTADNPVFRQGFPIITSFVDYVQLNSSFCGENFPFFDI